MKKIIYILALLLSSLSYYGQCITFNVDTILPSCSGCCDGSVTVTIIGGGCPPYTYVWSTGDNGTGTGLCFDSTVTLTISDAGQCCSDTSMFFRVSSSAQQQVTCGVFTFDVLITPVLCNGNCDGAIQISNISGGTPSYSYLWSNGDTTQSISNLCADDYTVFISDAVNNTCTMTFTVTQPDSLLVFASVTDASCAGCCDGSIVLTPTGGTPPYNYTLSDSLGFPIFPPYTNLCPSTYNWCVSDMNGCITCDTVVVSFATFINEHTNSTSFTVHPNPSTGKITITPSTSTNEIFYVTIYNLLGVELLTQSLTSNANTIDLTAYRKGIYLVRIVDKNGKQLFISRTVIQQ